MQSVPWYRVEGLQSLSIGRLASAGGVGVETIRYYQRRGLIETPGRHDGIRRYGSADVRRLRFIRQAQAAGFTLEEIKELLDLDERGPGARPRARHGPGQGARRANRGPERAATALRRLANECGSGSSGPCPILKSFEP